MRPYLAIIKDSFREAIHSRVLWILLVLISLLLVLIAPLTYHEELNTGLRERDVEEWPKLAASLREASQSTRKTGARRFWEAMDAEQRKSIDDFRPLKERPTFGDLQEFQARVRQVLKALEEPLEKLDLYHREYWTRSQLSPEGRQLVDRFDRLSKREITRLNRLLLEAAFPGQVRTSPPTSLQFSWAGMNIPPSLPIHKSQFAEGLLGRLPYVMDKFVLSIGLLVAMLVTAPLIPQTFDPGSLHLLLSKPVSRVMLYLTKFLGGCAFVLLAAAYLFVGLWLIFGARLGIWEHRLLWCIPIYTFVFAIYYSVATLAGAYYRNTVVSIALASLFWGVCFGVGVAKNVVAGFVDNSRITRIVSAGDTMIVQDNGGAPSFWNADEKRWELAPLSDEQAQLRFVAAMVEPPPGLGPIYDPIGDQLLSIGMSLKSYQIMVMSGQRERNWKQQDGVPSPAAAFAMVNEPDGHVLILAPSAVNRVMGDVAPEGVPLRVMGFAIPLAGYGPLKEVGPPSPNWSGHCAAGIDGASGSLVVYSRGNVELLDRTPDKQFVSVQQRKLEVSERDAALVARGGDTVIVALKDGTILTLDAATLKTHFSAQPDPKTAPKALVASPDGSYFALLNHESKLWLLARGQKRWQWAPVRGQRDISAIAFDKDGKLLVADRTTRVTQYDLPSGQQLRAWSPPMDLLDRVYRYALFPVYYVCPKPGEFYKTVQYLLTDQTTLSRGNRDLSETQQELNPLRPVASSLAFMLVMLGIGCVYMHFQEF
jgi:ABC-type transport system involved in multi-copper enzyme maturation permease subunit